MVTRQADHHYMGLALEQAKQAYALGEVPIGAVIVRDGDVIAQAHNRREMDHDPTAHAEVLAIRQAAMASGGWRLTGATIYVTIEPCPMCAGALIWARMTRLVYGGLDAKAGAVHSLMNLVQDQRLNHTLDVTAGVREDECTRLMRDFFARLRQKRNSSER